MDLSMLSLQLIVEGAALLIRQTVDIRLRTSAWFLQSNRKPLQVFLCPILPAFTCICVLIDNLLYVLFGAGHRQQHIKCSDFMPGLACLWMVATQCP